MKRLLVTGLSGFVGQHVRKAVESSGQERFQLAVPRDPIELTDPATIETAVGDARPDCVLHLAAQAFIPASVKDPRATYEVNFFGTLNLLQALKTSGFGGRVLYVGSADAYGVVPDEDLPSRNHARCGHAPRTGSARRQRNCCVANGPRIRTLTS